MTAQLKYKMKGLTCVGEFLSGGFVIQTGIWYFGGSLFTIVSTCQGPAYLVIL